MLAHGGQDPERSGVHWWSRRICTTTPGRAVSLTPTGTVRPQRPLLGSREASTATGKPPAMGRVKSLASVPARTSEFIWFPLPLLPVSRDQSRCFEDTSMAGPTVFDTALFMTTGDVTAVASCSTLSPLPPSTELPVIVTGPATATETPAEADPPNFESVTVTDAALPAFAQSDSERSSGLTPLDANTELFTVTVADSPVSTGAYLIARCWADNVPPDATAMPPQSPGSATLIDPSPSESPPMVSSAELVTVTGAAAEPSTFSEPKTVTGLDSAPFTTVPAAIVSVAPAGIVRLHLIS